MSFSQKLTYPKSQKVDQVDDYFGTKIKDPYRWLEDDNSPETKAWVIEENKVTSDYLSKIPFRESIKNRITELNNYPKYSAPFRVGEYFFFYKNDGLQNQSVLYYQKGFNGKPSIFLDPNTFSTDGTVAINIAGTSKDKKYLAYSISKSGSDWTELHVREISTKMDLSDKIEWTKFGGASFYKNGFFYSGYDKPKAEEELSKKNTFQKVYYHKLGDNQADDKLIYEDKENPLRYYGAGVTEDERFVVLTVSQGTGGSSIYVKDMKNPNNKGTKVDFKLIIDGFESESNIIDNIGDNLLLFTNIDAPNNKLVTVNYNNPKKSNWQTLIAQNKNVLTSVSKTGGKLFANYMQDVSSHIFQFSLHGKLEKEIQLPTLGSAGGFGGEDEDEFTFYSFSSFTYPPSIYKYDIKSGKSELFRTAEVKFNMDEFETKQIFYESKDGTKIPMFVVHKKGIKCDGNNPTLLYGYGGFNASMTPGFSPSRIAFLEQGGIYVMANIRGGGEFGEKWHKAGMLLNKQNVFDDFIYAAEYLIKEKYTSKEKLAIQGASNGGLLVGACMTQRPDLFKVCFPAVGVMDMLRFQKFTVGWGWVDDYGSSDSSNHFPYLLGYSPLHNIKEGVSYPATLITTADHDDRVVPAHSFKFAATLQEKQQGDNPVIIRIETKAGHGGGKSLTKAIDEVSDIYSFMFWNMGITPKY
jgi:prolyl oligopeptidase